MKQSFFPEQKVLVVSPINMFGATIIPTTILTVLKVIGKGDNTRITTKEYPNFTIPIANIKVLEEVQSGQ
jgi:hypothetical protein